MDRAGFPFVVLALLPAIGVALLGVPAVAAALLILPIAVALFFRDPDRSAPTDRDLILAPADGKVMFAGVAREGEAPEGPEGSWRQVTIFLSLLDVHINRTPVAGRVTRVLYRPGSFLPAYRHDSHRNEQSEIWFDHDGVVVVARQVVGLLARRVVCRVKTGDTVPAGGRIGLMKFGSRMDVFVPMSATLLVTEGQMVRGAETVIARLASRGPEPRA